MALSKRVKTLQPIFQAKRHINSQSAQGTGQPLLNPREVQGKIKHMFYISIRKHDI